MVRLRLQMQKNDESCLPIQVKGNQVQPITRKEGNDMSGQEIERAVRERIISILTNYGATRIAIFGSYARGEETPESDIDILVRFDHPKSLFQLVRIEDELAAALRRHVDLVTEKSVSPHIAGPIRRDEVVIFG